MIQQIKQRRDIQVIRAIAVIIVILFHFPKPLYLKGGFLGVDIFFVISGFLITQLLLSNQLQLSKSYFPFIRRRLRRLLPPLSLVILCTTIATFIFSPVARYMSTVQSAVSAQLFLSNFYFAHYLDSYWNPEVLLSPFLHTWSLGVELQFYLLMPLLFVGLSRSTDRNRALAQRFFIIGSASLTLFVIGNISNTQTMLTFSPGGFAFFVPFARLWEFLLGALVALRIDMSFPRRVFSHIWLLVLGITCLILGVVCASLEVASTSANTAAVCFGTILLLQAGQRSHASKDSVWSQIMCWIGDRSYGLYLWHWPILVVCNWLSLNLAMTVALVCILSAGLASLSYRYIEKRRDTTRSSAISGMLRPISLLAVAPIMVVLALVVGSTNWYLRPVNPAMLATSFPDPLASRLDEFANADDGCEETPLLTHCADFSSTTPEVIVIGDSLAYSTFPALHVAARAHGYNTSMLWTGGCGIRLNSCSNSKIGNQIYDYLATRNIALLVVSSNFEYETNIMTSVEESAGTKPRCPTDLTIEKCAIHLENVAKYVKESRQGIYKLLNFSDRILISLPFPQQTEEHPTCLNYSIWERLWADDSHSGSCGKTSREWQVARQGLYPQSIRDLASEFDGVHTWNPVDYLCNAVLCPAIINDGEEIYFDHIHITWLASRFLFPALDAELNSLNK